MINRIDNYDLCLGCGLCASILGKERCTMELGNDGFYLPVLKNCLSSKEKNLIKEICPGIRVASKPHKGIWGPVDSICEAWSAFSDIRHKSASGGVVTSLAIYLLENNKVDAILQVGTKSNHYLYNELCISRSRTDVIRCAQSRYAPVPAFVDIKQILDSNNETYALIGKPCDVAAMQNLVNFFPQYKDRIRFYISIFCAGMPSYNATIKTWQMSGHRDEPISLKYRGDGWPGNFRALFSDGTDFQLSYNESWGKILGRQLGFRCKICPDGIGVLADIAVGDSWNTKNGYPDFEDSDGRCFCMIRTEAGKKMFEDATREKYIIQQQLDINKVKEQQPYQFKRRLLEGWRLIPVQIMTKGILHFSNMNIIQNATKASIIEALRDMFGTFKRFYKLKNSNA